MDTYMYDGADNAFDDWNDDDIHDWFVPIDVPKPASDRTLEQLQALSAQVLELKTMFTTERAARLEQQQAFLLFQHNTGIELHKFQVCCVYTFILIYLANSRQAALGPREDSVWVCPVCELPLCNMRSFKGHIKKLVHPDKGVSHPHCFLRVTCERHKILVSRCGKPGDDFTVCSKEFSRLLWEHVQLLTSSDESPGVTC